MDQRNFRLSCQVPLFNVHVCFRFPILGTETGILAIISAKRKQSNHSLSNECANKLIRCKFKCFGSTWEILISSNIKSTKFSANETSLMLTRILSISIFSSISFVTLKFVGIKNMLSQSSVEMKEGNENAHR